MASCFPCSGCFRSSKKTITVKNILLDKQELIKEVNNRMTGQQLLDEIFHHLNLLETAYFGLRYQDLANQTHWLDPDKRIWKQLRNQGSLEGSSTCTLYLGVKFYAADPCRLVEELTRYQFFLQLKLDVLQGRLPVSQDLAIELAALALQSELGDFDPLRHSPGYASEFRFVSAQTEEMEEAVEAAHRRLNGVQPAQAEINYLEKVKWLDMYGVDLHPVVGEDNTDYFLGLTPSGIIVLRNRAKVGNYFWPRISKIYFKGRYFMLRVRDKNNDDNTYGFETPSRCACKHLWKCCVEHHAFFRLVQVSPTFGGGGVFSLGSKFKSSGVIERQTLQDVQQMERRPPPQFVRRPSSRYSRRNGQPSMEVDSPPPRAFAHMNGSLNRRRVSEPHHSTSSLPRNLSVPSAFCNQGNQQPESIQDLSLQSLQWLESRGLYGASGRRSSLSETGASHHYHRRPRKANSAVGVTTSAGGHHSDNDSDASGVSWASGQQHHHGHHHQSHHQRRLRNESGSETESRSSRRAHRGRRKRHGSYKLVESDEQWQAIQRQRQQQQGEHSGTARISRRSKTASNSYHEYGNGVGGAGGVRRSGYVNSGAETEAEMSQAPQASLRRNRRRQRSRSRSPAAEARSRLPAELLQHLEFGLVEPNPESLRGEIPFTKVESAVRPPHHAAAAAAAGAGGSYRSRSRHAHSMSTAAAAAVMAKKSHVQSMHLDMQQPQTPSMVASLTPANPIKSATPRRLANQAHNSTPSPRGWSQPPQQAVTPHNSVGLPLPPPPPPPPTAAPHHHHHHQQHQHLYFQTPPQYNGSSASALPPPTMHMKNGLPQSQAFPPIPTQSVRYNGVPVTPDESAMQRHPKSTPVFGNSSRLGRPGPPAPPPPPAPGHPNGILSHEMSTEL